MQFFVNNRGIVFAHLRNQFNMGEPVESQKKLIPHEEAIAKFNKEINQSRYGTDAQTITILRVILTYEPVRAANAEKRHGVCPNLGDCLPGSEGIPTGI